MKSKDHPQIHRKFSREEKSNTTTAIKQTTKKPQNIEDGQWFTNFHKTKQKNEEQMLNTFVMF